ncbi:MAG TPA: addiction module protein [Pyrinomonadaceae bacterium]|nr:addiction module protein [Pyrinomonadaceae bacterium]
MVVQRDKLVSEIRALSEEDKLRLFDVIPNELDKSDPEIDQIWANEARKRRSAYKEGRLSNNLL